MFECACGPLSFIRAREHKWCRMGKDALELETNASTANDQFGRFHNHGAYDAVTPEQIRVGYVSVAVVGCLSQQTSQPSYRKWQQKTDILGNEPFGFTVRDF